MAETVASLRQKLDRCQDRLRDAQAYRGPAFGFFAGTRSQPKKTSEKKTTNGETDGDGTSNGATSNGDTTASNGAPSDGDGGGSSGGSTTTGGSATGSADGAGGTSGEAMKDRKRRGSMGEHAELESELQRILDCWYPYEAPQQVTYELWKARLDDIGLNVADPDLAPTGYAASLRESASPLLLARRSSTAPLVEEAADSRRGLFDKTGSWLGSVFHAGRFRMTQVNDRKLGQRDEGWYGKGFYVSRSSEYVKRWYGPVVTSFKIDPNAKVLVAAVSSDKAPKGLMKAVLEHEAKLLRARGAEDRLKEVKNTLKENPIEWVHAVDRFADAQKYDVVYFNDHEIVVKSPKILKIEQTGTKKLREQTALLAERKQGLATRREKAARARGDHQAAEFWRKTRQGQQSNKSTSKSQERKRPTPRPRSATKDGFNARDITKPATS